MLVGDALFGLSSRNMGQYFSVDPKTGKTLWTSEPRQAGNAAIVYSGDLAFSLEDTGELKVFRHSANLVRDRASLHRGGLRDVGAADHHGQPDFREGCVEPDAVDAELRA